MAARARSSNGAKRVFGDYNGTPRRRLRAASDLDVAIPSPALILQNALIFEHAEPEVRKWPPVVGLTIVLVTCGGFWGLVGYGVASLLS
jgi:hypothetical protein